MDALHEDATAEQDGTLVWDFRAEHFALEPFVIRARSRVIEWERIALAGLAAALGLATIARAVWRRSVAPTK